MKNNYFYCREKNIPVTRWCTAALRCRSHWEDLETFPSTCSAVPGNGSAGKFAAQQAAIGLLIKYSFRMALYILGLQSHHSNVHEYRGYVCFCKAGTKSETKHAISFFSRIFLLFFPPFNLLPPHHTHTYLRSLEWKKKAQVPSEEMPATVITWVLQSSAAVWPVSTKAARSEKLRYYKRHKPAIAAIEILLVGGLK